MRCATLNFLVAVQASTWQQISFAGTKPSARVAHVAVWSDTANGLYIHGGAASGRLDELWFFSRQATTWQQISISGSKPSARHYHAGAWSDAADGLYIHGGDIGGWSQELWFFSRQATTWQLISPSGAQPGTRMSHVAAWSAAANGLYIFGGYTETPTTIYYDDLWFFSRQDTEWQLISPVGDKPSGRRFHAGAWSDAANGLYIHGGDRGSVYDDLWFFSRQATTWQQIIPIGTKPSARNNQGGAWSDAADGLYIYGGSDQLWFFSREATTWYLLSPSGDAPGLLHHPGVAWSEAADGLYIHGGAASGNVYKDELWFIQARSVATSTPATTTSWTSITSVTGTTATSTISATSVTSTISSSSTSVTASSSSITTSSSSSSSTSATTSSSSSTSTTTTTATSSSSSSSTSTTSTSTTSTNSSTSTSSTTSSSSTTSTTSTTSTNSTTSTTTTTSLSSSTSTTTTTSSSSSTSTSSTTSSSSTTSTTSTTSSSSSASTTSTTSSTSSSTSSTSTLSTSTASTTSTTSVLLFVTVELSASMLVISFNMEVQAFLSSRRLSEGLADCSELFQQDTVEKLGEEPGCSWERPDQLHVRFGSRPSLLLGDPVLLNPAAFGDLIPSELHGDFVLGATAVGADGDVTAVHAVLDAPSEATTCGALRLSAERSTGGAGRALLVSWRLEGAKGVSPERLEAWQGDLQQASASNSLVLALNTQGMEVNSDVEVNVSIWATNWQNQMDFASALVNVVPGNAPVLSAGRRVVLEASEELRLEVTVAPTSAESTCGGRVVVRWWFAPRPFRAWRTLSDAKLVDLSRKATELRLRPFSLAPETYDFRATAAYEGAQDLSERLFEVVVVSRPVAIISGVRSVSSTCAVQLESKSYDPDAELYNEEEAELQESWSCVSTEGCPVNETTGSNFEISGFPPGTYNISLEVWRRFESREEAGRTSHRLTVVDGDVATVTLSASWRSGELLPSSTSEVNVTGEVKCFGSAGQLEFVLISANQSVVQPLATETEPGRVWTSEFVGHGLQRGRSYRYALVAREVSVGQALEAEDIVAVSPPFVAALPPVPGFLDVRPSNGSALRTPFTLETHSWQDETPLRYSFYAFKDVATLDVRNIDYSDPDSPLFFRKRNGTLLRSWGSSSRAADLRLPEGSFTAVVRAQNQFGQEASQVSKQWIVEKLELEPEEVAAVLEASLSSADGEQILGTVSAMASSGISSPNLLDALEVAAGNIEPEPVVLSEMARVTDAVLQENREEVQEAAKILEKVIDLSAESGGAGEQVATAILGAVNTVEGESNQRATSLVTSLSAAMEEALPPGNDSAFVEAKTEDISLLVASTRAPVLQEDAINVAVERSHVARVMQNHSSWFDDLPLPGVPGEVEVLNSDPKVVQLSLPRFKGTAHVRIGFKAEIESGRRAVCIRKKGDKWSEGGLAVQDGGDFACVFQSSFETSEVTRLASISAVRVPFNYARAVATGCFTLAAMAFSWIYGNYKFLTRERYRSASSTSRDERDTVVLEERSTTDVPPPQGFSEG